MLPRILTFLLALLSAPALGGDWPQANHDAARSGRTLDEPRPPYRVQWVRQFPNEIIATRVEPIVAGGRVFAGTYSGQVHAMDGVTGRELWTADLDGPVLHSAAFSAGVLVTATAAGSVYGLKPEDGKVLWRSPLGDHGFDTAPLIVNGLVVLGSRGGTLFCLHLRSGQLKWKMPIGPPIRTSAASDGTLVYFGAEGMRARACELATGKLRWTSGPLPGQSMRDYYPVVAGSRVIYRTNPVGPFAERLNADRALLAKTAGIDLADGRALDAFLKSDRTRGGPDQIAREQHAVRAHLQANPDARTFFILDATTGRESALAPVLYAAGCQGVGGPPALAADGRLLVLDRTVFSNWSLGVAAPVGIGWLDPRTGALQPIRHESGAQPPWNTFWGTADETTRITIGGNSAFFAHQGTLARFDLKTRKLTSIAGIRDTHGGYPGPPWARNEWHGPARGALAISGDWLYWISGSRVIAVKGSAPGPSVPSKPEPGWTPPPPVAPDTVPVPTAVDLSETLRAAPSVGIGSEDAEEGKKLDAAVTQALSQNWRPLYVQPGLAGREFFFRSPAEKFEALLIAWPHIVPSLRSKTQDLLEVELSQRQPGVLNTPYALDKGRAREWFDAPAAFLADVKDPPAYPLQGCHALWLYGSVTQDWDAVQGMMPQLQEAFRALKGRWSELLGKRDENTNRVVADELAYARIASRIADPTAEEARKLAGEGVLALIEWMRTYDPAAEEKEIAGVAELDGIIGQGDTLFHAIRPHKGKIARLLGLTPELAMLLGRYAPNHVRALFGTIDRMMPGWYLMGEERQIHFGENFLDYPDQALAIYTARAGAGFDPPEKLRAWLDMPFCRADLYDIQKRAIYLSAERPDR